MASGTSNQSSLAWEKLTQDGTYPATCASGQLKYQVGDACGLKLEQTKGKPAKENSSRTGADLSRTRNGAQERGQNRQLSKRHMGVELEAQTRGLIGIQQQSIPPHTSDHHLSKHSLQKQTKQKHRPPARPMQLDGMSPHGQPPSDWHHQSVGGAGLSGPNGNSTMRTRNHSSGNGTKTATMRSS